ncbi:hypothetical protein GYMLUDRAFT_242792 [Collybiopsis luxurians FD-317 M1]|uniref:Endoplasmic oxidoreductin n=1 Tax=Collybiopsis luxurians FD-317 M1 TaxID=944289 RepID=A0A0D0BFJ8_9AGAR|nr:hypothetical protein GYMLUDRAFT_242792 [Collybiopsis luxurians FD-317 M1]
MPRRGLAHTLVFSNLAQYLVTAARGNSEGLMLPLSNDNSATVQAIFKAEAQEPIAITCLDKPAGPIDATLCNYETVESANNELHDHLSYLLRLPFFKFLQIDLYRGCPFWEDDATCTESTCSIPNVDESEIPEEWRMDALSKVNPVANTYHELGGCYYRDSDFCILEDPQLGDFYDLTTIPERYTGYTGNGPRQIWRAIYEENCFNPRSTTVGILPQKAESDQTCLEEQVYNKIISGLHASISTHICLDYLNQTTGEWGPNLQCYLGRVASHPERLEYIYFNTVLLLRAIARITSHLEQYDFYLGVAGADDDLNEAKRSLGRVVEIAKQVGKFNESWMFSGADAISLREDFKSHFRNVSRIMDCIDCDQCRLWGKVQTTGVATAMKILFELDENSFSFHTNSSLDTVIQRSELATLFNTLNRFSESIQAANRFREMWLEDYPSESDESLGIQSGIGTIYRYCKDSAVGCVGGVARLWTKGLKSLETFTRGLDKAEL